MQIDLATVKTAMETYLNETHFKISVDVTSVAQNGYGDVAKFDIEFRPKGFKSPDVAPE